VSEELETMEADASVVAEEARQAAAHE